VAPLLLLACAVAGTAIYLAMNPFETPKFEEPAADGPRADEVLRRCRQLMAAGRHDAARDLAAPWVRLHPRDVEVRPVLAEAQLALGRLAEAERTLNDLLRLSPDSARGLWLTGELTRRRGGQGYMDFYRRAAESEVDSDPEIHARYGLLLLASDDVEAAGKHLRSAHDAGLRDAPLLAGLGEVAMREKRYDSAEGFLAEAASGSEGEERTKVLMRLGALHEIRAKWMDAARVFAEAARSPALEASASLSAARCYYQAGRYAAAMKYVDIASSLRPSDGAVLEWRRKIEDARFGPPISAGAPAGPIAPEGQAAPQPR